MSFSMRFGARNLCLLCVCCMTGVGLAQQDTVRAEVASLEPNVPHRVLPFGSAGKSGFSRFSREWLGEKGVSFSVTYTGEAFTNVRRDARLRRGVEYLGSVDSSLEFDLKKLRIGRGQLVISAQSLHGRGINEARVGAIQAPSNLDSAPFSKVTEFWYADSYLDDRIRLKAGRQYADGDFNVAENAEEFLNSSYGLIPTIPMPTSPYSSTGASLWLAVTRRLSLGGGVFRGDPLPELEDGTKLGRKGTFSVMELKLSPFAATANFHGVYRFGLWSQGRGGLIWSETTARAVRNGGVYAATDHWFRRATSAGENTGPGVFLQAGWAPADRNEITAYAGAGVKWRGVIARRPHDSMGSGLTQAKLASGGRETALELYYRWNAFNKVIVQPDIQWIRNPCGSGRNSVLSGVRLMMEL